MVRTTICVLAYLTVYTLVISNCLSTVDTSVDAVVYIYTIACTAVYALVYDTVCTNASTMAEVITDANQQARWSICDMSPQGHYTI